MKIIILDYFDGTVHFGDVEEGQIEEHEEWLVEKGFGLNNIEWMVVDDLKIEGID